MSDELIITALVIAEHRQSYRIHHNGKELTAQVTGKFIAQAAARLDFPTVGDFVTATLHDSGAKAIINEVLPRKSMLLRKSADSAKDAQPLAANIDKVFIVMGLDGNYNLARLERMLVAARDSGAVPVVILTKKDLCPAHELDAILAAVTQRSQGAAVACVCATTGEGVDAVRQLLPGEITCCFVGSSGVGKSTLLNRLCGFEAAATGAVSNAQSRGRHTTVARQLYFLPGGARIIDTPGVREFGLDYAQNGIADSFADIEELATQCRFKNCSHDAEPDCAVQAAIASGKITAGRLKNYKKMLKAMYREAIKCNTRQQFLAKRKFKAFARQCRGITVNKRKLRGG